MMTSIFVDADACPVKAEITKVADRHGLSVYMVANGAMRLPESPNLTRVLVGEGFDVADLVDRNNANQPQTSFIIIYAHEFDYVF